MNTDDDLSEPLYRVACAAIREKESGLIIAGVRHYDGIMRTMIRLIDPERITPSLYACEQGFLDNKGGFLTREQAWVIAEKAGQIRPHPSMKPGILHSEDLY